MFGHPLAERDDAGRRSDAGEPPDRAEQVERRRASRRICRGEQRHETQRREDPQRIREGRDRVGLVHDRLTSRHDHHQEVAPDHDRLRQHIQDWRFRERGVNPRQQPDPIDEQAQRDHSDRDEHPHQSPSLGREITRQQQPVVGDEQHRQCRRHLFRQHGKQSARARRHRRKGSTPRTWRNVAVRRQGAFCHSGEEQRTEDEEAAQNLRPRRDVPGGLGLNRVHREERGAGEGSPGVGARAVQVTTCGATCAAKQAPEEREQQQGDGRVQQNARHVVAERPIPPQRCDPPHRKN